MKKEVLIVSEWSYYKWNWIKFWGKRNENKFLKNLVLGLTQNEYDMLCLQTPKMFITIHTIVIITTTFALNIELHLF